MAHAVGPRDPRPPWRIRPLPHAHQFNQGRRKTRRNVAIFIGCVRASPQAIACASVGSRGLGVGGPCCVKAHAHGRDTCGLHEPRRQRRPKLGLQQRAEAEREADQQPLDGVAIQNGWKQRPRGPPGRQFLRRSVSYARVMNVLKQNDQNDQFILSSALCLQHTRSSLGAARQTEASRGPPLSGQRTQFVGHMGPSPRELPDISSR